MIQAGLVSGLHVDICNALSRPSNMGNSWH